MFGIGVLRGILCPLEKAFMAGVVRSVVGKPDRLTRHLKESGKRNWTIVRSGSAVHALTHRHSRSRVQQRGRSRLPSASKSNQSLLRSLSGQKSALRHLEGLFSPTTKAQPSKIIFPFDAIFLR